MTQQYVNKVDLVGRVGQTPDVRYFESGAMKTSLTLAVKPPYRSENPLWFDLELWGNIAQVAADWVQKGSTIGITGEIVFDRWIDKNTNESRQKPIIRVSNLELISSAQRKDSNETSEDQDSIINANF
ncbi:single-stranded DNA-binding protein [Nodularia spumigena CS-584]|jgi:single-strand DNA-binding protein|uniref:Single-stranded DNA-binding protein n=1 Tax=Nodularia spumigena UHCC 0060 TaxID=3110300 RepID=A0ABU5UVC8_NODSP|nr:MULTISPECIES: single-stranded DNA-binding protein [Nostocales]MDK2410420.1 single-stranded DNA-binding protein [Aphanizomenon sp. 202]MDK2460899.1 single-stranded DNA-binding protein [Aphanizomenon sp. PH219]AHJ29355.1 Single-stranded DNA-binding protein [Nodularia spumigena CCY9414]EAW45287.1 Single-strand binding protein [Nodularia spumigena CCY9414]MDB9382945.1 single-stranded DNA-binding protein [Nodularia spumigena CS-584]